MSTGCDHGADLGEMGGHGLAVAARHDKARALAALWADSAEDVSGLGPLIVRRRRPCPAPRPTSGDLVLLTHPRLVLEPDFYLGAGRERRADIRQAGREVFLKASIASASWA